MSQESTAHPGESRTRRESRALIEAVFANATDAIVLVDAAGTIACATPATAAALGHDVDALVGATVFEFLHPDDLESAADLFTRRLMFDGQDQGKEVRVRHSSGAWVPLVATAVVLADSELAACAITLRSTGGTADRELSLRRRIVIGEYTNQLSADLMGASDTAAVVRRIEDSLGEIGLLTGAKVVGLCIDRPELGAVELLAGWRAGSEPALTMEDLCASPAAVEELLRSHVVIDEPNESAAQRQPALAELVRGTHGAGVLSTPFVSGGRRGALVLIRFDDDAGWWDSDSELVRRVAVLFGRAFQTVWSEELLALTYQLGPVGFSIRTWDGILVDCNQRYLDLYGMTRDEASGTSLLDIVLPEYRDPVIEQLAALRDGLVDRFTAEVEVTRGDGTIMWVRTNVVPMQVPGSNERFVLTAVENITSAQQHKIELEYAANHDSLTGVANRAAMRRAIEHEFAANGVMPGLLIIDLDRFKLINDSIGHNAGDMVLKEVADRIAAHVRGSDLVARLGGDEFAIVAPGLGADGSVSLAERLQAAFAEPIDIDGILLQQTISVGIALGEDATDLTDLMVKADRALYAAKRDGRNCFVVFNDTMRDAVLQRLVMERELRYAIDHGQLEIHLQPEFSVADQRRILGAEALVRWRHPVRGLVPAGEFISVAEQSRLIDDIGRFALRRATKSFVHVCEAVDRHDLVLRVNISAREFARAELRDLVLDALSESGLPPTQLCLEMTETTLMDAPEVALATMQGLHEIGVRFAIDDFGTGYSSLAYLKKFPVDAVKIDRAFVADIESDGDSRAIIESILGLCEAMSLEAVAEGVETDGQLAELRRFGCARAQGWLVAPALPVEEFILRLGAVRARKVASVA